MPRIIAEILVNQYPEVVKEIVTFVYKRVHPRFPLRFKVNQEEVDDITKRVLRSLKRKK